MENRKHKSAILILMLCGAAFLVSARAQAPSNPPPQKPANNAAPDSQQQDQKPGANPFPEDTNSVPVLPSANNPGTPEPSAEPPSYGNAALPGGDNDPVRSPDDAAPSSANSDVSSSSAGMDNLLKPPPDEERGKHGKLDAPEHTESAKEDESVGGYYLDQKNWKAALSRFESALVLDPENPEVYWGLAESQRHTGDFASAKANYLKVMEYDPDSKHSKEAKKILKEPEMESARAVPASSPAQPRQ
ncbi:MAG TPA: tetratricopeptide repeat protein [Terracidiphilus sp.]|nr:tetratricopeptide repeat protein [Terracidiphilus sp.]